MARTTREPDEALLRQTEEIELSARSRRFAVVHVLLT